MSMYWKFRKLDYFSVALELKNRLPELKKSDCEVIADNLRGSNLHFYQSKKVEAPFLIRLTLPFAFVMFILMLITLPINFIFTGEWGYKIKWIKNWFEMLGF